MLPGKIEMLIIKMRQNSVWMGVLWKILSCGCFACINAIVRYLTGGSPLPLDSPLPVYTVMFFQHLIGAIIIIPGILLNSLVINKIVIKQHCFFKQFATQKPLLHVIRVITAAIGIGMWYLSLQYIPIPQVVALSFATPIITILGSILFLGEKVNIFRGIAIGLTLMGSFLITRPDLQSSYSSWTMIFPLLATLLFALDKLIARKLLVLKESPSSLTLYLLLFMSPLCFMCMLWYGWEMPNYTHMLWLTLLGILSAGAHYTFNKAFALAEVTFLMPFGMTKLILSALVSYFAFIELPNSFNLWVGIIILAGSTLMLSLQSIGSVSKLSSRFS